MVIGKKHLIRLWTLAIVALLFVGEVLAQDAQWRGPNRDGRYMDTALLKSWPEEGPELILKKEGLGNGYSTPILYEGAIYISGRRDSVDVLTRLDLEGNISWETVYGMAWDKSYPESRSTPTIENGYIYIMDGLGKVNCLDTESGKIIWEVNTHEQFEGVFHRWGMTESLLLTENAVISSPIGKKTAVVALDKKDGSLLWQTDSVGGSRAYVSPLMINYKGQDMILVTSNEDMIAVDPENGNIIWCQDIVTGHANNWGFLNNTNTPLYKDGDIFTTSGYDADGLMMTLAEDGRSVEVKWHDKTLDVHHGGVVLVDGYLYGANWINNGNGNWVCQEWETGKVMWEEKWNNKGSIIYADGMLYLFEEKKGHVALLKPNPEAFELVSFFKLDGGEGPFWAHPSIYEQKLFVRHGTVLFVYDIAIKN